jgi:hypothetical protein
MPSNSTISSSDKTKIKSYLPSYKILTGTVARIYNAYPEPDKWTYSGLQGVLVFARERSGSAFWFKLVDLTGAKGVIWEHGFYQGEFEYFKDRDFFHSFAGDVSPALFAIRGLFIRIIGTYDRICIRGGQ